MHSIDILIKALRMKNIHVKKVKVKKDIRIQWEYCQSLSKPNQFLKMELK
ncbi:hypothetical protein [Priestia megaterium]|nr:hypothetical protein [Priestia megaterium]MDP1442114.1 hypothetical protein [Priestia megaterium]MDP1471109.1 hypothetical protein [Priestia megaterium]